jgi:hypothetical protein
MPVTKRTTGIEQHDVEIASNGKMLETVIEQNHIGGVAFHSQPDAFCPARRNKYKGAVVALRQQVRFVAANLWWQERTFPRADHTYPAGALTSVAAADHCHPPAASLQPFHQIIDHRGLASSPDRQVTDRDDRDRGPVNGKHPSPVEFPAQPANQTVQTPGNTQQRKKHLLREACRPRRHQLPMES